MQNRFALASSALLLACGASATHAQQRPAARPLGPVVATSKEALGALSAVRELPGGLLLANDPTKRQVLLMDSTLNVVGVVADSTPATATAYGARPGGLIPYRGDSTLFVDPASLSMLVIDPKGKIGRVMAAPRPNDVMFLVGGPMGNPGFDAQGRLVYRNLNRNFGGGRPPAPGQPFTPPPQPDSAPVLRFDLATRKLDTAGFIRTPKVNMVVTQTEGGINMTTKVNPMNIIDDWAVLPDGSIAMVRGRDYHVDFVYPDGSTAKGPKLPFEWQRMDDSTKAAVLDSARTVMEAARKSGNVVTGTGAATNITGGGGGMMVVSSTTINSGAPQVTVGSAPRNVQLPPLTFVDPSELPDYRPAFASGATRADAEGRLWIRTVPMKPLAGGAEYDVVDRTGKLVDRVAIPKATTIVGFGAGGNVYLGIRDAAGVHVVRAKVR